MFSQRDYLLEDGREVGWPIQIYILKSMLVGIFHFLKAIYTWIEDITVQCKTVRSSLRIGWNSTTKSVELDHFVCVVILQDASNTIDDL